MDADRVQARAQPFPRTGDTGNDVVLLTRHLAGGHNRGGTAG